MTVYTSLSSASVRLIAKFGSDWDLVCLPVSTPDPDKPWRATSSGEVKATPKGVLATFDKEEIDGQRILATDGKLIVASADAALASAPAGFDPGLVVFADKGGKRYAAVAIDDVKPGDESLVRTYRLRQS